MDDWSVPAVIPDIPVGGKPIFHVYLVPVGIEFGLLLSGIVSNVSPEHIFRVILSIFGVGFTVSVVLKVLVHWSGIEPLFAVTV